MSRNRSAVTGDGKVSFPKLECWNPMTEVATIAAELNGQRVLCKIPMKVLTKQFKADVEAPMVAVAENRDLLQATAKRLIESKSYQDDGTILIEEKDLQS